MGSALGAEEDWAAVPATDSALEAEVGWAKALAAATGVARELAAVRALALAMGADWVADWAMARAAGLGPACLCRFR